MRKEVKDAKCQHYGKCPNEYECKAGIDLLSFNGGDSAGYIRKLPCFGASGLFDDNPIATCEQYSPFTEEELEAQEKEWAERICHMIEARAQIVSDSGGKRGVAGVIKCPVCGNRLHYTIAGYNGHIHATCAYQGCLSWME